MDYITITKENLEKEHICCALSNNQDIQVSSKKSWLSATLEEGLCFIKRAERGKCFIEYIPAKNAWIPIDANEYMYINCFWVSGSFKGHVYSNELLNMCMEDAKEKGFEGLCILSSDKKKPFLSDPKYLMHKGFQLADTSDVGINLFYLPFHNQANVPKFKECAKHPHIEEQGYVVYYTSQCPFTAKYVPMIEEIAKERNVAFQKIHIKDKKTARNVPSPVTTYALFYNGKFVTNEILSDKKFIKLIESKIG